MSKKFVLQATNILEKYGIEDTQKLISGFIEGDKWPTKKNLLLMVNLFLFHNKDISSIIDVVDTLYELQRTNKVSQCVCNEKNIMVDNYVCKSFYDFSTYIIGLYTLTPTQSEIIEINHTIFIDNPIYEKNGIKIFLGDTYEKCVNYCHGGLTNLDYSFCIGLPGNKNFAKMRGIKSSTFYFVLDTKYQNKDGHYCLNDYLHMVVLDVTKDCDPNNLQTIITTDSRNVETGCLCGVEKEMYLQDLYNRCGDSLTSVLVNIPYHQNEKLNIDIEEISLEQFMRLPYKQKLEYVMSGHDLRPDFLKYLLKKL